jgi:flagellar biosynthetic protein FlhB
MLSALVAGGAQTQFQTAPDALKTKWTKLNPVTGLKRIFSWKQLIPAGLSILKLVVIGRLLYGTVSGIASDPIFYSIVDAARIAEYLASSTYSITARVLAVMFVIAGLDYTYQRWRTGEDLKMTKQEVKDEMKNSEGDPLVKQQRNRMAGRASKRKMLENVPEADVIITNPTHFAVALKYDVDAMQAPRVVAKGTRLFALKIKALAKENGVPIREDKPLARFMYKHCEVDGQIPAELFATVAKILAIVYRENRYRYFRKKAE